MDANLILALFGVFASVALAAGALGWFVLSRTSPERRRLEQVGRLAVSGVLVDTATLSEKQDAVTEQMVKLMPRAPKEMAKLRKQLARAGYQTLRAVGVYTAAQFLTPAVLCVAALFAPNSGFEKYVLVGVAAMVGMQLPSIVVQRLTKRRQKAIERGLPDALDLLIVCLEAGSAIDQAIVRVSDELAIVYKPLAEELRLIITETRAGKRRIDAFRSFADRAGVEDVRSLVAMLVQTDRFGTSMAQALRTQAETSRTLRRQRAEEQAAKMGVKLVFPLVLLLFPAFFIVALGPAVIKMVKVFF